MYSSRINYMPLKYVYVYLQQKRLQANRGLVYVLKNVIPKEAIGGKEKQASQRG